MVVGLSSKLGILEAFWPQIFFPSQSTIIREDKINYVVAFRQSWHNLKIFKNPLTSYTRDVVSPLYSLSDLTSTYTE